MTFLSNGPVLLPCLLLTVLLLAGNATLHLFPSWAATREAHLLAYIWVGTVLAAWMAGVHEAQSLNVLKDWFDGLTVRQFFLGAGSGVGLFVVGGIGYAVTQGLGIEQSEVARALARPQGIRSWVISITMTLVLAPVVEEVAFRGWIFRQLQTTIPTWEAVVLSATLFAIYHLSAFQFLSTFLLGVGLALLTVYAQTLWPAVIAHLAYNGIGLLFFALGTRTG